MNSVQHGIFDSLPKDAAMSSSGTVSTSATAMTGTPTVAGRTWEVVPTMKDGDERGLLANSLSWGEVLAPAA